MPEEYPTFQHRWFGEVWNKGRAEAIDEMCSTDVVAHGLIDAEGNEIRGLEAFKAFFANFRSAFPDIHVTVEDTVTEGDKVVARCTVRATHRGEGLGVAATDLPVEFHGTSLWHMRDGKISHTWDMYDFLNLFQQVGAVKFLAK